MQYSPFENVRNFTELDKLSYDDLKVLESVDERYSIEYKSEYSKSFREEKLAKTVSAFANSNGGWLFVGIDDSGHVVDIDLTSITKEQIYSIIDKSIIKLGF